MGNWLNTYQKVTSQTGKPVTLFTDHAPWRNNPWIEIQGAGRRYRNNGKGGWEIQQISQSSGTWDPVNVVDEEYWTNYVNDIDKKRKETPALNIFLKLFGIEGKTPEKACGGKVLKGEDGMVAGEFPPDWNQGEIRQGFQKARPGWLQKFDNWADKKSEELNNPKKTGPLGLLIGPAFDYLTLRSGNIGYAAILPGVGVANTAGKTAVSKGAQLEKQIALAFQARGLKELMQLWEAENMVKNNRALDAIDYLLKHNNSKTELFIKDFNLKDLISEPHINFENLTLTKRQGGKISDLLNNQEFLISLEKCGGKMKKKACGGKMKKKK